jgi:hypothetical protein
MLALRNIFAGDQPARLKTYLILFIEYWSFFSSL